MAYKRPVALLRQLDCLFFLVDEVIAGGGGGGGSQGPAGPQGLPGVDGEDGAQGQQGIQGVQGNPGVDGVRTASTAFGYSAGAGGTVTQLTNKTTAVTLNKLTGDITMATGAGVCSIAVRNTSAGSLNEAPVLKFAVIKAVTT